MASKDFRPKSITPLLGVTSGDKGIIFKRSGGDRVFRRGLCRNSVAPAFHNNTVQGKYEYCIYARNTL